MWLIAPVAGTLAASALLIGCGKGREQKKAPQRPSRPGDKSKSVKSSKTTASGSASKRPLNKGAPVPKKSSSSVSRSASHSSKAKGSARSSSSSKRAKRAVPAAGAAAGAAAAVKKAPSSKKTSNREKKSGSLRDDKTQASVSSKEAEKSGRSSRSKRSVSAGIKSGKETKSGVEKSNKEENKNIKEEGKTVKGETKTAVLADAAAAKAASAAIEAPKEPSERPTERALAQPVSVSVVVPAATGAKVPSVPRVDLKLEPAELRWKATGGLQSVSVVNTSDKRRALKVKCSDNLLYRVNPVCAFVEPGEAVRVDVLRQNGAPKLDKLVVVAAEASREDSDARAVAGRNVNNDMMVLPMIATAAE